MSWTSSVRLIYVQFTSCVYVATNHKTNRFQSKPLRLQLKNDRLNDVTATPLIKKTEGEFIPGRCFKKQLLCNCAKQLKTFVEDFWLFAAFVFFVHCRLKNIPLAVFFNTFIFLNHMTTNVVIFFLFFYLIFLLLR